MCYRVPTGQNIGAKLLHPVRAMSAKQRILCVSNREMLMKARQEWLEEAGFFVASAYGSHQASRIYELGHGFDLLVLGYSVSRADKLAMIELFRSNCKAPILSVRMHGDAPLRQAEFSIEIGRAHV